MNRTFIKTPNGSRFRYEDSEETKLKKKVKNLERTVEELKKEMEKQREIIHSLWYAPGMPGAREASEMWQKDT
tara:strand:- start:927 stop:1145 length:219 start_codon:yes stop_codon:yes gene_type:complete